MTPAPARVVLITGAASGIGAATARLIAGPGTALALATRSNAAGLALVAAECERSGSLVTMHLGDLEESGEGRRVVEATRAAFGHVDQVVSNSGHAHRCAIENLTVADLERSFRAMPMAFLEIVGAALPDLLESRWARVVAVSSFVAHAFGTGGFHFPATGAAKAAVEALAKSMAVQLAPKGITVNCVAPGFTEKDAKPSGTRAALDMREALPSIPTGSLTRSADVASMIAYLLSHEARQVTGQVMHVDGGLSLP